jgi:metal-responsive CopG/Arc/MetJ family transcriptional regulator
MPESVVIPATRISKKLWAYLEEIMKRKMFTSKSELVKEALREYVTKHKEELGSKDFDIIDAMIVLKEGRDEDKKREKELLEWIEKLRP